MVFQEDRFYNINEEFRFFKYRAKMEKNASWFETKDFIFTNYKIVEKKICWYKGYDDLKYTPK